MAAAHWLSKFGYAPLGEGGEHTLAQWVRGAFQYQALTDLNRSFSETFLEGISKLSFEEIEKKLLDEGAKRVQYDPASKREPDISGTYLLENCCIALSWYKDESKFGVNLYSLDLSTHQKYVDYFDEILQPVSSSGRIYMLQKTDSGFNLTNMGLAGLEAEEKNYTPEIVKSFHHIVSDLKNKSPCGRLSILEGEPGTGKTYLIRGIIHAAQDSLFVLVPPSLIQELSSPEFVPALTQLKTNEESPGPTVLIFEDADSILVERQASNMGSISSCLNLSDGIIGSVLDIRIIASTNSKKVEIDDAIIRDGRLCQYASIGPLGNTQAHDIYERLTGKKIDPKDDPLTDKEHTLAEIYKKARLASKEELIGTKEHGRPRRRRRVGFHGLPS